MNSDEIHGTAGVGHFLNLINAPAAGSGSYRLQDPHSGRYVKVHEKHLPAIVGLIPTGLIPRFHSILHLVEQLRQKPTGSDITRYQDELEKAEMALEQSQKDVLNALWAARKNYLTWQRIDPAAILPSNKDPDGKTVITLVSEAIDEPNGYYFPEKGRSAWFNAHGRVSVDPYQIKALKPTGAMAVFLEGAMAEHAADPATRLALIRHGLFIYVVQAKKLNGRKRLFAKLVHDGKRNIHMTHWARITGSDPAQLMKLSGINPRTLDGSPKNSKPTVSWRERSGKGQSPS